MKKIYLSIIGLLFCAFAFAQKTQISGKVFDVNTSAPIADANVKVAGKTLAKTDNNGSFTIATEIPAEIVVSHVKYQTVRQSLTNANTTLNIGLAALSQNLNEVEITATSAKDKSLLSQPASIVKLQETELKRGNGLFLDDAINGNVPGVTMQRRTISAGQQFNIRGYGNGTRGTNGVNSNFDSQGSKVYLNGIPVTDAEGITLMDDIDFGSIGNVEITKGPAGTLYGLAIAGVVNLQTKKAKAGETAVGQDVLFGSYGLRRYTTHLEIGSEHSSILVNYGKQKYDGFMPHTNSEKDFINVVADFQPNEKQSITTYFGYSNSYDQRNGELDTTQYKNKDYSGNIRYIRNDAHSNIISFRAGLGHTYAFTKNIGNTTSVFASGVSNNVSSAGGFTDKAPVNFGLRSTVDMHFALNSEFNLSGITGVETQQQRAQTVGYSMIDPQGKPHEVLWKLGDPYFVIGSYPTVIPTVTGSTTVNNNGNTANIYTRTATTSLFTEWTLAMPYDFSVTAGLGLSNMNIDLKDRLYAPGKVTHYEKSYNNLFSPHFAINKVFNKQISAYASYSKGYKAPVSSYFFIPTTGQVNTNLKSEIGNQYEIGTKGELFGNKLSYQVAIFDAIFSNKMTAVAVPDPTKTATLYSYVVNGGKQNNKGAEVLVKYTAYQSNSGIITAIRPFANYAYSDFKYEDFKFETIKKTTGQPDVLVVNDYSGNAVAGVSRNTANAGIDFGAIYGIYGNVNYLYKEGMPFTSDGINKTASYGLLNAKLGVHRTIATHFDVDASFGATNITGKQYPFMVFSNQLPDAYLPAPYKVNFFGGLNVKYIF